MKRLFVFLFVTQVLCLLSSCFRHYDGHMNFVLVNKSGRTIGFQEREFNHSDTSSDTLISWGMSYVKPDSSCAFEQFWNSWEVEFTSCSYYQLLIVDGEVYKKYKDEPIDSIRKKVPILHIYQLTQSDLEKMNWTVIYPPVGDLKNKIVSPDHRK